MVRVRQAGAEVTQTFWAKLAGHRGLTKEQRYRHIVRSFLDP
jgi:hypothetical protein